MSAHIQGAVTPAGQNSHNLGDLTSNEAQEIRQQYLQEHRVAIVDSIRTPFVKAPGALKGCDSVDLGAHVISRLSEKMRLDPRAVEEVVAGNVLQNLNTTNPAREMVLKSALPKNDINTKSITDYCITSLTAISILADDISSGKIKVGIAVGAESMTNAPISYSRGERQKLVDIQLQKSPLKQAFDYYVKFKIPHLFSRPRPPGAKEPSTGLSMGEHMELTAKEYGISREAQDSFAYNSHMKAAAAQSAGIFRDQIAGIKAGRKDIAKDNIIRPDTTLELMASKEPAFDKTSGRGTLTAPNSTTFTDGASAMCLMSEKEAIAQGRHIKAFIKGVQFAAIDPMEDGLLQAPAKAVPELLKKLGLTVADIDRFEIHEAFAAQVLDNLRSWRDGWPKYGIAPIGEIPAEKINVFGGSLAIGHPFAATGIRLLMISDELDRLKQATGKRQRALVSACAAGGRACAMVLETD